MRTSVALVFLASLSIVGSVALLNYFPTRRDTDENAVTPASGGDVSSEADVAGPSLVRQADAAFDRGQVDDAFALYRRTLEQSPEEIRAHARIAQIALVRSVQDVAETHAEAIIRLAPSSTEAQAASAALAYLRAQNQPMQDAAAQSASNVLQDKPDEFIARWIVIQSFIDKGNGCDAIPLIDQAISEAPNWYELEQLKLVVYSETGDQAGAGRQLETMHRKFPEREDVAEWLIGWYETTGQVEAAEAVLRKLVTTSSDELAASLRLVEHIRKAKGDQAGDSEMMRLSEAASSPAVKAELTFALASSLTERDQADAAVQLLERFLEQPNLDAEQAVRAKLELARVKAEAGDQEAAIGLITEVIGSDSTNQAALKLRASILIQAREGERALSDLWAALSQDSTDLEAMKLMAAAFQLDGRDALAGDILARAVEISDYADEQVALYVDFLRQNGQDRTAEFILGVAQSKNSNEDDVPDAAAPSTAPEAIVAQCNSGDGLTP